LQYQLIMELSPHNDANRLLTPDALSSLLLADQNTQNIAVYQLALTHKSYQRRRGITSNATKDVVPLQAGCNERLEFLGDSVLSLVIARYLYERYPRADEGLLSQMRSKLVNGEMLARLSRCAGLTDHVLMSSKIESGGGRTNKRILEDAFEAFVGAMFLDVGFDDTRRWIIGVFEKHVDFAGVMLATESPKDKFIKWYRARNVAPATISEIESVGSRTRIAIKDGNGRVVGIGEGSNRKDAENAAARNALAYFGQTSVADPTAATATSKYDVSK
jgi:ribonuclease III